MNLATSFNLLDLSPQADQAQAKKAYKAQVRRWHPDQFPEGSPMKAKAEERLKQVNLAYARVKMHLAASRPTPGVTAAATPFQPKRDATADSQQPDSNPKQRSWINHLFDTLNRVADMVNDNPSRPTAEIKRPKPAKRFQQVLDETAGGRFPSGQIRRNNVADVNVRRTAAGYRRNRRSGATIGAVGGADHPGPVKPVSRVRGIGRSR